MVSDWARQSISSVQRINFHIRWCAQLKEKFIETANLKLAALTSGDQSSPPVLALHGWLDNAASFIPIEKYLAGINLIALDFPGHGKSRHRDGVNAYHFIDYATDVILAANALGLKQFNLLGHSLGAAVAAVVAAVVPEKVLRLAMVEGLAPVTGAPENMLDQLRQHVDQSCKPASAKPSFQSVEKAGMARKLAGDLSLSSATLIAKRNLVRSSEGYTWRTDKCLRKPSPLYLTDIHVQHYLGKVECNALLIRSDKGIIKNWESLSGRETHMKNLEIIDIQGGHHCHMDNPETVAPHLLNFLKDP